MQLYVLPLLSDGTAMGDPAPVLEPVTPPLLDVQVAVYPVIGLPPVTGATNATEICVAPGVAVGWAGAVGTVAGTVEPEAGDSKELPTALVAWTVQV